MRVNRLEPVFVDQVPTALQPGVLYVSMPFNTTVHLCACGCSNETWVPIRPDRHHLTYDGEHITLVGSIGNWRFPCRSHYWVKDNQVVWADAPASEVAATDTQPAGWRRLLNPILDFVRRPFDRRV